MLMGMTLAVSGCLRITDPIYFGKPLRPDEPPASNYSLVLVSIEGPDSFESFDTIVFRRPDPDVGVGYFYKSSAFIYRVFSRRGVKDGHFLIALPPGVYELERLQSRSWLTGVVRYTVSDKSRPSTRIYVTRPGIYDLGTLEIRSNGWTRPFEIAAMGDRGSRQRLGLLREAIRGTGWEARVASN